MAPPGLGRINQVRYVGGIRRAGVQHVRKPFAASRADDVAAEARHARVVSTDGSVDRPCRAEGEAKEISGGPAWVRQGIPDGVGTSRGIAGKGVRRAADVLI